MTNLLDRRRSLQSSKQGYIKFKDPVVEQLCVSNWSSDGVGLTRSDAAAVTDQQIFSFTQSGQGFRNRANIVSFDELKYFSGLTTICSYFLAGCTSLISLVLPSGIERLSYNCFLDTSLQFVVIPSRVVSLEAGVFNGVPNKSITLIMEGSVPPTINLYTFENGMTPTIYVPYSARHTVLDAYKSAENWSRYASSIFELNPDGSILNN